MNNDRDLDGLRALVTGATSGIGMAAAQQLARHGAEVIVHDREAHGTAVAGPTAELDMATFDQLFATSIVPTLSWRTNWGLPIAATTMAACRLPARRGRVHHGGAAAGLAFIRAAAPSPAARTPAPARSHR